MDEIKYSCLDGRLVEAGEARIPIRDRCVLYGEGLFETIRVSGGRALLIERHMERLEKGCVVLGLRPDVGAVRAAIEDVIEANDMVEGSLRLTVTGGEPGRDRERVRIRESDEGRFFITGQKGARYSSEEYQKGYSGFVSSIRRNPYSPLTYVKSVDFMENIMAREEARRAGYDEALFLNTEGFLTEGSITNIFIVSGGYVRTPDIESGLLPGITRQVVIDICRENNISVKEERIRLEELVDSDEAFLTNTLMGIMPLVEIEGRRIGVRGERDFRNMPITGRLTSLYNSYIKT